MMLLLLLSTGVATASSLSTASRMSAPLAAATTASSIVSRGLGGALWRMRLVGGRRNRSSTAATAAGFVPSSNTIGTKTSTWARQRQRHALPSALAMTAARRPRAAVSSPFTQSRVAAAGKADRCLAWGGVGHSKLSQQLTFSSRTAGARVPAATAVGGGSSSEHTAAPTAADEAWKELGRKEEAGTAIFKVNLLEMSKAEVEEFLVGMGEPKFRAKQIRKWILEGGAGSFEDMNNIPKTLRAKLAEVATVGVLEVAAKQVSKDGTKKLAYRLADGQIIESVLMPYSDGRRTACISSQAGCAMGCVFCATGQMGFKRQLSAAEIFEQAYHFSQELRARGDRLSNVVFMGMGEPLANYKNVMEAVRRINTELGIGARHITISTVGLVPRIIRLSQEDIQVKLAVSLHAANDRERSALLPVNRRFPLLELMEACREYVDASGRRMTFEWALIQGENDSPEVASELGRLLRPLKGMCHVNIIPLNPTAGYNGGPSMADAVNQFVDVLARNGVPATPRIRRGIDIDAGCGQLTVKVAQDNVLGKGL